MVVIETPNSAPRKRGFRWEKFLWMYMRVSGTLLIVMIFTHLLVNLFLPEGGVAAINFAFVAGKWASPFWKFFDLLLLWLALIHGTNGMRTIINDYAERAWVRKTLMTLLIITTVVLLVLGSLVITTFDPCIDPAAVNYLSSICK